MTDLKEGCLFDRAKNIFTKCLIWPYHLETFKKIIIVSYYFFFL